MCVSDSPASAASGMSDSCIQRATAQDGRVWPGVISAGPRCIATRRRAEQPYGARSLFGRR
jgi:hypothetical protein